MEEVGQFGDLQKLMVTDTLAPYLTVAKDFEGVDVIPVPLFGRCLIQGLHPDNVSTVQGNWIDNGHHVSGTSSLPMNDDLLSPEHALLLLRETSTLSCLPW